MKKIYIILLLLIGFVCNLTAENVCNDWESCSNSGYYDEKVCTDGGFIRRKCYSLHVPEGWSGRRIGLTTTTPHILKNQSLDLTRAGFATYCESHAGTITSSIYVKVNHNGGYNKVLIPTSEIWGKNLSSCASRTVHFTNDQLLSILGSADFGENGCIDLTFVWVMRADVYAASLNRWGMVVTDTCMVRVYDCESGIAGRITANQKVTPILDVKDGDSIFAVYPTDVLPNVGLPIIVSESPIIYTLASVRQNQKSVWTLTNGDNELIGVLPITTPMNSNYQNRSQTYAYSLLNPTGVLTPGYEYRVVRTNRVSDNAECSTNTLSFKVVEPAVLEGFDQDKLKRYVCEVLNLSSLYNFGESSDDYLFIEGNKLNVDGQSVYGIKYKWQYKKSTSGTWITLPEYESSSADGAVCNYNSGASTLFSAHYQSSPQDLYVIRSMFESGVAYDFRQIAYLTRFSNREVTADSNGVIRVTAYKNISSSDFKVNGMGTSCADGSTNEVTLGVGFLPSQSGVYCYADQKIDSGNLNYTYSFDGNSGTEQTSQLTKTFNVSESSPKTIYANVTVTDGCETEVRLKDSLVFEQQPALDPNFVECSKASSVYSSENKRVEISIPDGVTGTLSVNSSDEDYAVSTYLYSEDGVGYTVMNKRGLEIKLGTLSHKDLWLMKRNNGGSMCESVPVEVRVSKVGAISGNTIYNDTMYVCSGEYNPQINADNVNGGYQSGYTYKWLYSNDNITYSVMLDADDAVITTSSLGASAWNMPVTQKKYIRRVASSSSGNGTLSDTSAFMVLMPYSKPTLTVSSNSDFACYDTEVTLSISLDPVVSSQIDKTQSQSRSIQTAYGYAYRDGGEYTNIGKTNTAAFDYDMNIKQDTLIYATLEMCESQYVSKGLKITSGVDLSPTLANGDCKVRGDKMKVSVVGAKADCQYVIKQNGEQVGETVADLQIPEQGSVTYQVTVSDASCERTFDRSVDQTLLKEAFKHYDLAVDDRQLTTKDLLCAGIQHTFGNIEGEGNTIATNYAWYVDGKSLPNSNTATLNYALPSTGVSYKLVRKSIEIENGFTCQSIFDTISVRTYSNISGSEITLGRDIVCFGDSVEIRLSGMGGSGQSSYGYTIYDGEAILASGSVTVDDVASEYVSLSSVGNHSLYAVVTDNLTCTNSDLYSQKTSSVIVYQAESADFSLTASPSLIEEGSGLTPISITAEAVNGDKVIGDKFAYSYTTADGNIKGESVGNFLIKVDDGDFTNGVLTVGVDRTVSSTGCVATSKVIITQSVGFEDQPTIISDAMADADRVEVCGGVEVTLSLAKLPTYGSKTLTPADVKYFWYRNGSLVGNDSAYKATAVAGDTSVYLCKITYQYDEAQKDAYIFSNEFHIIGKKGVVLGNLVDETTNAKSKVICKGSSESILLSVNVDLETKDVLIWEQSQDGEYWTIVPENNLVTEQVGTSLEIKGESYSLGQGTYYFRVRGQSECGTTTYSKNIFTLKVDTLPEIPVVTLRSGNVISSNVTSLSFSPKKDYAGFRYEWGSTEDDLLEAVSQGSSQAVLSGDYKVGSNTVYVRKVATTGGNCVSGVTAYSFDLFQELTIGSLFSDNSKEFRCPSDGDVTLYVNNIKGGSGTYAISWEYKTEGGNWIPFDSESVLPFTVSGGESRATTGYLYSLFVSGLNATTTFRATVSSTGDYKGVSKITNEITIAFYDALKDEGIDNAEVLLCYGSCLSKIEGKMPSGGNGEYAYQWYKTITPEDNASWLPVTNATQQSYNHKDTVYNTTYYKRMLLDGCGSSLESKQKRVEVSEPVLITLEDVNYNRAVSDGEQAKMWGVRRSSTDESEFVWYSKDWNVLDTTEVTVPYLTTGLYADGTQKTYSYYAKKIDPVSGCMSYNTDTLLITAYSNTSGQIFINGTTQEDEDRFWVCPGITDIEVLSEMNPENSIRYNWYYRITTESSPTETTVGNWTSLRRGNGALVTSENVNLDTCNIGSAMKNATGRKKYVELKRVATFIIGGEETQMESNTVSIHIVPTMASVNNLYDIVGSISSEKTRYCHGEEAETVSGVEDMGSEPVIYWDNAASYFGPWLYDGTYDSEGFSTWFEYKKADEEAYDTSKICKYNTSTGYAMNFLPGEGVEHTMNSTYNIRRAISDGCTSAYTSSLNLSVTDAVGTIGNVVTYGYETGNRVKMFKGFEIGDSIVIGYQSSDGADCVWSLDSLFSDTLEAKKTYVGFPITESKAIRLMQDSHIYMKRLSSGCWSSTLSIPVALGSASQGGTIGSDQKSCYGTEFEMIGSITPATGDWIAPTYTPMRWTYGWQYSADSLTWVNIAGADSIVLTKDLVNKYASLMSGNDSYFRRIATNDSARTRYSNAVKLSYYGELKPGTLTMDRDMKGFCSDETFPILSSSSATGGRVEDYSVQYTWQVSLDGGDYRDIDYFKTNTLNLSFVDTLTSLSRDRNRTVQIQCKYTDGAYGCGSVLSDPLSFTLYRSNSEPNIYQDNDSCDAELVTVKVVPEEISKTYYFVSFVVDEQGNDSITWKSETNQQTIKRVSNMIADEYGVYSVDNQTGCVSTYTKFNVDSLPELSQSELSYPTVVCFGEDFEISGQQATGGNGSKAYQWQYSYDGTEWETLSGREEETLQVKNPKKSIYYRRIVTDMCDADTTEPAFVRVRDEIQASKNVLVFNDYKCEGRMFNINKAEDAVFTDSDYYLIWNSATDDTDDTKGMVRLTVEGFEGDSLEMSLTHVVVDSAGLLCQSKPLTVYAHNAVSIEHDQNTIKCDDLTPCNGRYVDITGETQANNHPERISYKWYVSKDAILWTEQLLKTGKDLNLEIEDTVFVMRTAYNGCEYDTSNVVTIIGTKVDDYDYVTALSLSIVSNMQDSSVVMNIEGGKEFPNNYCFEGDGILPTVSSNATLFPYSIETYQDSVLTLTAISEHCVNTYRIRPLSGGVISFDGDSILCGQGDIPAIVATDVKGATGTYTYQWQYNNTFTSDFINIDGATSKEYTPTAVSVPTSYRRVTTSGEYIAYSNVVKVNIRPLPKCNDITLSLSDKVLNWYGLGRTQYSVEKLPSVELSLIDSISDVDEVTWQKSYDGIQWENVETQDANNDGYYSLYITDTLETVYYRAVGSSSCSEAVSKSFKVTTVYAPVILDEELVITDNICKGDPYVRIAFKRDYSDIYAYTFKTIGYEGSGVFSCSSSSKITASTEDYYLTSTLNRLDDTTSTSTGAIFTYPRRSFDVEITRTVKTTGASSSKIVHFTVDDLSASFSYIVDGLDYHTSGEAEQSVRLNQGSRVVFTPQVENAMGELSYKWNLIEPLNTSYYATYGGSIGREGLTSELEQPACYFYNGGEYKIQMTVTDGMCSVTLRDSALYIDRNTVRSYRNDASFVDDTYNEIAELSDNFIYLDVYPTMIDDFFCLSTNSTNTEYFVLYDSKGIKVREGYYKTLLKVYVSDLPRGVYTLNSQGKSIRIVKF